MSKLIGQNEFWSPPSQTELAVVEPLPEQSMPRRRSGPHGASIPAVAGFVPFAEEEIEQSIPARFAQQVRAHSQRIAIKSERYAVTYATLNQWANRVAHALIAASGTVSEPIALLLERDAPHVAAILGTLKAGKIYVPLAPSYPLARNQLILDDIKARWVVTDNANLRTAWVLAGESASILNIDALEEPLDESDPELEIGPDAFAYILYTSGSTGRPKGIVETHRNVLHNVMNVTNDQYINCNDRTLGLSSFAYSGSLKEAYGSLLNGGTLYPLDVEQVGLRGLAHRLIEEEITVFGAVSTTFRHFVSSLSGDERFPKLRVIRVGAEEVTWKDIELYKAHFPPECVLVNGYGATETGTIRIHAIDHETPAVGSAVPIGYPVEGMEVRLLDDEGEPVGVNEIGQIAVRSAYLSPGYWRQPELTRQVFLPDPEGGDHRVYLTGDLGKMELDGCLIHAGRKDHQVKVRGHRIEISEIEMALREAPGVGEAVVLARNDLPEDRRIVAYVVATAAPDSRSSRPLRDFLAERLPSSSLPSAFVWLDAMPLTPSGKLDRKALPAPEPTRLAQSAEISRPRTGLEKQLVAIWEELTGRRPIGIDDDFFDLGGNSLLAARVFAEIHKSLGKNLPLETLLSAPTIEQLAEVLGGMLEAAPARPVVLALKASGSQIPFFAIPGTATHPFSLYDLASLSDPEQPFFGLLYPDLGPEPPYPTRIEDLAARFLPEILKIQPKGPYRLGGHSFGGVVALELAQQLIALGHEVSLLAMMDTWGKSFPRLRPLPLRLVDHLQRIGTLSSREKLAYLSEKVRAIKAKIQAALGLPANDSSSHDANPAVDDVTAQMLHINHLAWCQYQPRVYPGRIVLFRAEQTPNWVGTQFDDPCLGWGGLAAHGIEVHTVPTDHWKLLHREGIKSLARVLNAYLRD